MLLSLLLAVALIAVCFRPQTIRKRNPDAPEPRALTGANPSAATDANPIDNTEIFVRQHYADFLSREPDEDGLAFWIDNIDSCDEDAQCREVKRIDTSAAYFLS